MLEVTSRIDGNAVIVKIAGRVDSTNAPQLDSQIEAAGPSERLVLDAEGLEYISSAGLRVILKHRKKHADTEIVNASTEVYEILDMTGFTEMMSVKRAYRTVSVEGCEVIGQGANGKVYRIDPDTVVKVYLREDCLADIEHEREVAKKALVLGIPTAISYDVVRVGSHYASMFEMLNAKSFSQLMAADPEGLEKYAVLFVKLLKQIHATEVPAGQLPDQREALLQWVDFISSCLPEDVYRKMRRMCEEIPTCSYMIHGDYHTKNTMLQDGEVILIDMDTLAVGHPVLEFGAMYNTFFGFAMVDHSRTKEFLDYDYDTARKFWEAVLRLYYGTDDKGVLALREKQAQTVGLVRLLRRSIRRKNEPELFEYGKAEFCRLVRELDSLV